MSLGFDVEKIEGNYSRAELLKGIRGEVKNLSRANAFALYFSKRRGDESELLQSIFDDKNQPRQIKLVALREAGRQPTTVANELLVKNLATQDPSFLAKTVRLLGQAGNPEVIEELDKLNLKRTHLAYETVQFAKKLIAFRHRIKGESFTVPNASRIVPIVGERSAKLMTSPALIRNEEAVLKKIQDVVPGLGITFSGAARIVCREDVFVLTFNKDFVGKERLLSLRDGNALPMILLRQGPEPDRFVLSQYFFTQPTRKKGELKLIGARPGGTLTHSGTVTVTDDHFVFAIKTVQNPYVAGLDMEGVFDYESGRFEFLKATSATFIDREKNPQRIPRKSSD